MPTKDKGAIGKNSGGLILIREVKDNGGVVSGGSWVSLGYIQESRTQDNTEMEDYTDETGHTVASEPITRNVKLTGLLMQSDKTTLDYMKETIRNSYFAVYKYEGELNGKHQEIFYGICRFKPQVDLASGTKRPPFEATVLNNESAIYFIDTAQSNIMQWSSGGTISDEDLYVYVVDSNGGRLYQETTGAPGQLGTSAPTHTSGSAANGDITLAFRGFCNFIDTTNMHVDGSTPFSISANTYYVIKETDI